jgi:hypothetical protein
MKLKRKGIKVVLMQSLLVDTLTKYMKLVGESGENYIAEKLPDKFVLVFDDWLNF